MANGKKIGVLGTGPVGQTIADRLAGLGHSVFVSTRDPKETMARTWNDNFGNPPFKVWREAHPQIGFGTLAQAAAHGEIVVNATTGTASLAALEEAGHANLAGKVLVDISNPLDFSRGMPPSLTVCNTDSLGEQIQKAFPDVRVVKTLNTMSCYLMVGPAQLAGGNHTVFVSGDDAGAKQTVRELLRSFGWEDIVDLGDITTARGTEMMLPIWARVFVATGNPMFSFKLVRQPVYMIGASELLIIVLTLGLLGLQIFSIVHIATGDFDSSDKKILWLLVVIFVGVIGPILYLLIGRQSRFKAGETVMPKQR